MVRHRRHSGGLPRPRRRQEARPLLSNPRPLSDQGPRVLPPLQPHQQLALQQVALHVRRHALRLSQGNQYFSIAPHGAYLL